MLLLLGGAAKPHTRVKKTRYSPFKSLRADLYFSFLFKACLSFAGVNGETLVHMMEEREIYISRGSACSSKKAGNRILENMGLPPEQILGSVRVSFSKLTTIEEAKEAGRALNECYKVLKQKLAWK